MQKKQFRVYFLTSLLLCLITNSLFVYSQLVPLKVAAHDMTDYANNSIQKFTITYKYTKDNNTVTLYTDSYSVGETVTPRTAPTFDGYIFSGWQWPDNKVLSTMPASNLTVSGYFYQSEQKVTDNESGLAFDVAVTAMSGSTGSVTLNSLPEAVLKGEKEIPSQISAAGKTYTVTKVNASAFDNLAEGVIVYLPQSAATTADVVNVVNNGSKVKTLDLSQVKKFALPSSVSSVAATEVKYTRTITGSSTVVTMPYEVAVPKGFKAYTLKGANNKKAQFEEYTGEKLAAYTPYLLVKQSGEVAAARALLADDDAATTETETTIDLSAKNVTIKPEPESAAQGDDQMSLSGTVSAISNDRGYIFGMYKLQEDGSWDMTAVENDPSEYIAPFSGYLMVCIVNIEGRIVNEYNNVLAPVSRTIHVATAGTLPNLISETEKYQIGELILTGELNGTDLRLIRDMAGNNYRGELTMGQLKKLDLTNARIVAGGEMYLDTDVMSYIGLKVKGLNLRFYIETDNEIGVFLFAGCSRLAEIKLPVSTRLICANAFYRCHNLETVRISEKVTAIGSGAFESCPNLASINIPKSVCSINWSTFVGCTNLSVIAVDPANSVYESPSGCNAIIERETKKLVIGCKGTSVTADVKSIGEYAFYSCTGIMSLHLPYGLEKIENYAFKDCDNLVSIDIPNSVTTIGISAFDGCI